MGVSFQGKVGFSLHADVDVQMAKDSSDGGPEPGGAPFTARVLRL